MVMINHDSTYGGSFGIDIDQRPMTAYCFQTISIHLGIRVRQVHPTILPSRRTFRDTLAQDDLLPGNLVGVQAA